MITPTVHMNGTSHKDLTEGYEKADDALRDFIEAFGGIEFNARDYYVQGPETYTQAREERMAINQKLRDIQDYLNAIRISLYDQTPKSRA